MIGNDLRHVCYFLDIISNEGTSSESSSDIEVLNCHSDWDNYTAEEKFDRIFKHVSFSPIPTTSGTRADTPNENTHISCTSQHNLNDIFDVLSNEDDENNVNEVLNASSEQRNRRKRKKPGSPTVFQLRMQNKKQKNMGKAYVNRKGQKKAPKMIKNTCNGCKYKCHMKISNEERLQIFTNFWNLGDHNVQTQYILSLIETLPCEQRRKYKNKRKESNAYYLKEKNKKARVCVKMFTNTLSISRKKVQTAMKKRTTSNTLKYNDLRGKHEPKNKTSSSDMQFIINHINSYPAFESHYSRSKSQKKYLHPDLNISKMYKQYTDLCTEENRQPKCYQTYYKVFKKQKLFFKHPYNDTCDTCDRLKMQITRNKSIGQTEKEKLENELKDHAKKYTEAYEEKRRDKERARQNSEICVKAIDLQKVLETPFLTTGKSFYKRQLSTYNLTIHDLSTNQVTCYMWCEVDGGRGSDEIASILYKDITSGVPDNCKHLVIYSDNCAGQNHNFTLPLMYQQTIKLKPNLQTIEHKFLEPGHTHMECDTDHSKIERNKPKEMSIFTPRDWYNMVRMIPSGKGKRMLVTEMKYSDFFKFKCLCEGSNAVYVRRLKFIDGVDVEWMKNRYIKIVKNKPQYIELSKSITGVNSHILNIVRRSTKPENVMLQQKYFNYLPISDKKFNNLLSLLQYIPQEYHNFYKNITHNSRVPDIHPDLLSDSEDE